MSKINDGGPAFPQHVAPAYRQEPEIWGMSLRAYMATQIAAGLVAHSGSFGLGFGPGDIATRSCEIADALIASLEEGGAE